MDPLTQQAVLNLVVRWSIWILIIKTNLQVNCQQMDYS